MSPLLCTTGRCVEREDTLGQDRLLQGSWRAPLRLVGQKAISSVSQFASNSEVAQERGDSARHMPPASSPMAGPCLYTEIHLGPAPCSLLLVSFFSLYSPLVRSCSVKSSLKICRSFLVAHDALPFPFMDSLSVLFPFLDLGLWSSLHFCALDFLHAPGSLLLSHEHSPFSQCLWMLQKTDFSPLVLPAGLGPR